MRFLILLLMMVSFLHAGEQADLQKTMVEWQSRLYLKAWVITVKPVPRLALQMLAHRDVAALSFWDPDTGTVIMFVMARQDYTKELMKEWEVTNAKRDQKNSVIHELLHGVMKIHPSEEGRVTAIANAITK